MCCDFALVSHLIFSYRQDAYSQRLSEKREKTLDKQHFVWYNVLYTERHMMTNMFQLKDQDRPMSDSQPKIKRGQKLCPNCNTINGVRTFVCKNCEAEFKMKKGRKRPRTKKVEDYKTLERGDTIKVVGGSGPYHTSRETGERTYMIDRGKYTVISTDITGIQVYGPNGYGYLYMGEIKPSLLIDSITQAPCKILKVYLQKR